MKGKKGTGKGKGFGAVTMATAFTVLDEPERKLVSCAKEARSANTLGDDYNPFEVYSPPGQMGPRRTIVSDWNHWRHHLIEARLSVLFGNVVKSLSKFQQSPGVVVTEFEIADGDTEQIESCGKRFPMPGGTPSDILQSIKRGMQHTSLTQVSRCTGNCDGSSDGV